MRNPLCWLIRRRLGAYQDGELSSAARARTAGHLARCAGCAGEVRALERLGAALALEAPDPGDAVWDTFWPQVRARMAAAGPADDAALPRPAWSWGSLLGDRRLAFGSALAAGALAVVVLAPWQQPEQPLTPVAPVVTVVPAPPAQDSDVVVQSVETADPQSSVMVFSNPDAEVTVVWVFGLERT
jgi:anti-sigma factor RsiW